MRLAMHRFMRAAVATLATLAAFAVVVALPLAAQSGTRAPARKPVRRPATSAGKPAKATAPDSVRLRFGWTPGTTALVEGGTIRERASGASRDTVAMQVRYRMSVAPHAEGMVVRVDSFSMPGLRGDDGGDASPMMQRVAAQLGQGTSNYVVAPGGEFRHLEDVAAAKATVDSAFAPMLREMKDAPPQLRQMMEQATSPEMLTAAAQREWNLLVGAWAGANWVIGEVYESRVDEPNPMLQGMVMPTVYQFSATERIACDDADSSAVRAARRDCVTLRMIATPDSAAMRAFVREFVKRMAPEAAAQMTQLLESMRTETEVTVVTEPATLRPHFMSQVQRVEVRARGTGGELEEAMQQENGRWLRFRYVEAAATAPR